MNYSIDIFYWYMLASQDIFVTQLKKKTIISIIVAQQDFQHLHSTHQWERWGLHTTPTLKHSQSCCPVMPRGPLWYGVITFASVVVLANVMVLARTLFLTRVRMLSHARDAMVLTHVMVLTHDTVLVGFIWKSDNLSIQ